MHRNDHGFRKSAVRQLIFGEHAYPCGVGPYDERWAMAVGLNLPVMRPILFAAAFEMLQFEPEFTFQYRSRDNDRAEK
jgi:hypothetical protein